MPRKARIVVPGVAHHVTQRGNNQQDVFLVDDDRRAYLRLLKEQADKYELEVLGYCLMNNHVHLVVRPYEAASLANAVGRTHWRYTQYVNALHGRSGHLWQSRFYSCALDERHTAAALRRIAGNEITDIAELLGHKKLDSTRRYQNIKPQALKDRIKPIFRDEDNG